MLSAKAGLKLVHLAFWAQLGVLTRVFLDKFFQLGCGGGWGPCIQGKTSIADVKQPAAAPMSTDFVHFLRAGGSSFYSLPSNMLGSFIIGVFAPSSTLGLDNQKAMAVLPAGHAWQANYALQIGEFAT